MTSTVGWEYPWAAPGAMWVDGAPRVVWVEDSEHAQISVDIREIVQAWADDPNANFGLVMGCADDAPGGIAFSGVDSRGAAAAPRLVVHYSLRSP